MSQKRVKFPKKKWLRVDSLKIQGRICKRPPSILIGLRVDIYKTQGLIYQEATPHAIWTVG
jgi:hypothetical protein